MLYLLSFSMTDNSLYTRILDFFDFRINSSLYQKPVYVYLTKSHGQVGQLVNFNFQRYLNPN